MPFVKGQSGNPLGRPPVDPAAKAERARAAARERMRRLRVERDAGVEPLPAVADADLGEVVLPEIDPVTIAKAMRLAGLEAARFAQETMRDPTVDVKYRLAAANLLANRGWMDAPRDPSVLVQQNNVVFDRERAAQVVESLRARFGKPA